MNTFLVFLLYKKFYFLLVYLLTLPFHSRTIAFSSFYIKSKYIRVYKRKFYKFSNMLCHVKIDRHFNTQYMLCICFLYEITLKRISSDFMKEINLNYNKRRKLTMHLIYSKCKKSFECDFINSSVTKLINNI